MPKVREVIVGVFDFVGVTPNNSSIQLLSVPGAFSILIHNSLKESFPDCVAVVDADNAILFLGGNMNCIKEVLHRPLVVI